MFDRTTILPGTRVIGADWNDIGEVKNLIFDRGTTEVSKLVIEAHTLKTDYKLLDIGEISRFLDSGKLITLKLTRDMVETLPDIEPTNQNLK